MKNGKEQEHFCQDLEFVNKTKLSARRSLHDEISSIRPTDSARVTQVSRMLCPSPTNALEGLLKSRRPND